MSILFYKRPDYIPRGDGPLNLSDCQKYVERAACSKGSIPAELSFENIIQGRTLPPTSLQDFMDYLVYVAHDAENLQFYLWIRDYTERFNALPESEKCLSPVWNAEEELPSQRATSKVPQSEKALHNLSIGPDTMFDKIGPGAPVESEPDRHQSLSDMTISNPDAVVAEANRQAGLSWQPFSIQPFRHEVTLIISNYIVPGSSRELNLSHQDRRAVLRALQHTTHPSAFARLLQLTSLSLRTQSHQNFVRWSICNGNKPRVLFLRSFAVFWLSMGFLLSIVLVLSRQSRWWRIWVALIWWFGITNLVAAYKGLCVLLFRLRTREIHPWETETPETPLKLAFPEHTKSISEVELGRPTSSYSSPASSFRDAKMSPFGPSNTFEHEAWVSKWRRQSSWRKLVLRKVQVKEEGLRIMQNSIVRQAELWALFITIPAVIVVTALPKGNMF